ncbi:MAG: hypothetical protein JEY97_14630 [Bacteroidales bacterium]|nr:hypothetical protein [Bacteroidales bacterium]
MPEKQSKKKKKKPHSINEKQKLAKKVKAIIETTEEQNKALGKILKMRDSKTKTRQD